MRKLWGLVAVVGGAGVLFLASMALWIWVTIPSEPDPNALASSVLEPPAAAYRGAVEEGQQVARSLVAKEKLPGLSLAVAVDGKIVWAEGIGWIDVESQTQVTPTTVFRIGGVSQALTAAAVGLLSQRGRLELDAPVQRYLPNFPEKEWPISTRQLMSHTAGIRRLAGEEEIFRKTHCSEDAERLAIFADAPLRFRPDTDYLYSPYGWVVVGAVVAATAHEPYLDFMKREIFSPLGMENTKPDVAMQAGSGNTHFYYPRLMLQPRYGLEDAPDVDLSCILPAAGFVSTPSDLVRFGSAMMGDTLLGSAIVEELHTPVQLASGEATEQALGWIVRSVPLGANGSPTQIAGQGLESPVRRSRTGAASVGGRVPGETTTLMIVPKYRMAIAVATNVSGAENVSLLTTRLADIFVRYLDRAGLKKQSK